MLGYDFNGHVDDNLVYANTTDGILVENYSSGGGLITNNTVYQVSGDAVRLDSSAFNVKLRNNIVWVQAGYDIYVADNSRTGFNSDYNDLYIGNGGSANVGFWNSAVNNGVQSQLSNWQSATGQDAHSISANPDFVNINGNDGCWATRRSTASMPITARTTTSTFPAAPRPSPAAIPGTRP